MSSLFDPQEFLDREVVGAMDTKAAVMPLGRYNFTVDKLTIRRIEPGPGDTYETFHVLEVECFADGNQADATGKPLKDTTGKEKNYARYKGPFDVDPATGAIDRAKGKNITLGALRAACGMNDPDQPFRVGMLKGQMFSGEVFHTPNKKDPERPFAEIRLPLPRQ